MGYDGLKLTCCSTKSWVQEFQINREREIWSHSASIMEIFKSEQIIKASDNPYNENYTENN